MTAIAITADIAAWRNAPMMVSAVASIVTAVPPASGATATPDRRTGAALTAFAPRLRHHLHARPSRPAAPSRARYPAGHRFSVTGRALSAVPQLVELSRQEAGQRIVGRQQHRVRCRLQPPQVGGDRGQRVIGRQFAASAGSICVERGLAAAGSAPASPAPLRRAPAASAPVCPSASAISASFCG